MEQTIKKGTLVLAALFLAVVALLTTWGLLTDPAGYSLYENRSLAVPEELTVQTLLDASFLQSLEPVFSDHIAARDRWLKAYTLLQTEILRKQAVQGLVLQEDLLLPLNTVAEREDPGPAAEAMARNLLTLQQEVERYGGTFLFTAVPEQSSVLRDRYPAAYENHDGLFSNRQAALFAAGGEKGVEMLDMTPLFLASEDPNRLYCAADHHYRLDGAYLAYRAICDRLLAQGVEIPVLTEEQFTWRTLPNPYLGSRGRKLMGLWDNGEKLMVYDLKDPIPFTRTDNGQPVEATVFDLPQTETEFVQYNAYMGGDKAETIIQTNRPELPDCLLFGDSFTNGLETFLYTSFDETRSLDLRHYTQMGILEYVRTHQPDVVLCLQNDTVYLLQEGNGVIR